MDAEWMLPTGFYFYSIYSSGLRFWGHYPTLLDVVETGHFLPRQSRLSQIDRPGEKRIKLFCVKVRECVSVIESLTVF